MTDDGREPHIEAVEGARWRGEILIIRGESEIRSDAAVGEDDGSPFEHVEAVGRRRRWTGFRELKGD